MGKSEVKWLTRLLKIRPEKLVEPASFDFRLKVQKIAFLLSHLKVSPFTDYTFSLYLHGPYSPDLAKDYYGLEKVKVEPVRLDRKNTNTLKWLALKDERWLEVASSIISVRDRYPNAAKKEILSTLTMSKPWITRDMFEGVMTDLASKRL